MNTPSENNRLDYLDAVRAFALLLGIVFHTSLSFVPLDISWAIMDVSTSQLIVVFVLVSHSFRMELFFLIAGFFSHLTLHKKGVRSFLASRFVRIVLPFVVAWFIVRPLLVSGWIMGFFKSLQGEVNIRAGLLLGFRSLQTLPDGIFTGTHLWFLYYLTLVTVAVLLAVKGLALLPRLKQSLGSLVDSALRILAGNSWGTLILAIPTACCIPFMSDWGMDTPDKSLIPHLPSYLVFLWFFALGWVIHRQPRLLDAFSRLTPVRGIILVASLVLTLFFVRYQTQAGFEYFQHARMAFSFSYSVLMWSLIFGTIGIFRLLITTPNRAIRYIADSSYWLYLVHLPIVVWFQVAFAKLPMHWSLKLVSISTLTIAISLLIYDLAIRPTLVGRILNGTAKPSFLISKKSSVARN